MRQKRCASRVHACCSCGVPRWPWATENEVPVNRTMVTKTTRRMSASPFELKVLENRMPRCVTIFCLFSRNTSPLAGQRPPSVFGIVVGINAAGVESEAIARCCSVLGRYPSLSTDFTFRTGQLSPAGITRTLASPLNRAWELTSSSTDTTLRSVSGFQLSVRSRSPGNICHRDRHQARRCGFRNAIGSS